MTAVFSGVVRGMTPEQKLEGEVGLTRQKKQWVHSQQIRHDSYVSVRVKTIHAAGLNQGWDAIRGYRDPDGKKPSAPLLACDMHFFEWKMDHWKILHILSAMTWLTGSFWVPYLKRWKQVPWLESYCNNPNRR